MAATHCWSRIAAAGAYRSSIAIVAKVVAEYDVGRGLADLANLPGGRYLLAVDQVASQLLLIDSRDRLIRIVERINVSPDPVRLVVSADGALGVVSSRWSRRLTFIGLAKRACLLEPPRCRVLGTLDMPFCPQELAMAG